MDEQTRPREIVRLLVRRIKDNLGRLNAARPNENLLLESDQYEDIQLRLPHINAALKPLIEDATELLRHPETAEGSWPGLRAVASYEVGGPLLLMFWHREPIRYIIAYELCRLNTGYYRGKSALAKTSGKAKTPTEPAAHAAETRPAPCWIAANDSRQRAINSDDGPTLDSPKKIYGWLKEKDDGDYKLPKFKSWTRYLRKYDQLMIDRPANSPRGRRTGRSIVPAAKL